ncbi:MAG: serpin family protein [Bacteroidota bacterium]|nr:serpin family protein [Bacteroidota bacterium]
MKHLILVLFLTTSMTLIGYSQYNEVVKGNNEFAFEFYQSISDNDNNLFFSPYSISIALAMTYEGAGGETAKEMQTTMHFPESRSDMQTAFRKLLEDNSKQEENYVFKSANSLWASKQIEFHKDYFSRVNKFYNAPAEQVNFRRTKARETTRKKINHWTEKETEGKIKDLLQENDLSFETILVLVNAVYFKAEWHKKFKKRATVENVFYSFNSKQKTLFMNQKSRMKFYKDKLHLHLEIPYYSRKASLHIFMPDNENAFQEFQKKFDFQYFSSILKQSKYETVKLSLPKFKINNRMYLSDNLKDAGIKLAFESKSDFSGMSDTSDISIDKVIHQSFINTNENGTEAAAATAVVMKRETALPPQNEIIFNVNKPFIFVITDNSTGSVLFTGHYIKPE